MNRTLILAVAALVTSACTSSDPTTTTNQPVFAAAGDLNGDGRPDVVVVDPGVKQVKVLLGRGDGTFQPAAAIAAGLNPVSVAIADLDGDGRADLVVADYAANGVSVYLGRGDGTFATATTYPTAAGPAYVAVGDFDGDGKVDLAVTANVGGAVSVLLGRGGGTFAPKVDYPTGTYPVAIAAADLNGDGRLDLAVVTFGASPTTGSVGTLLGNGDGTFRAWTAYPVNAGPEALAVADCNGDGRRDLIVASVASTNTLTCLLGLGDGTFPTRVDSVGGVGPTSLVALDLDGNGVIDVAVTDSTAQTVNLLVGSGTGTFSAWQTLFLPRGVSPLSVFAADLNADGRSDLAFIGYESNSLFVYLGAGAGTFQGTSVPL